MGRPGGGVVAPMLGTAFAALPPTGLEAFSLDKLGRPGWWGVWRSGIKEEAAGRGTAAAPNATPAWSATRPRCTTRQIAAKPGPSAAGLFGQGAEGEFDAFADPDLLGQCLERCGGLAVVVAQSQQGLKNVGLGVAAGMVG